MTTDHRSLAAVPAPTAPTITPDQLALIKQTIAKDATDLELELFFYDCARRGVHPLDKLIHFTKRGGKYTPVTSIDFMRSRAAMTGDYAGQDDVIFSGAVGNGEFTATVTVYRLVHDQRCAFTATARWSEYKPDQDFMWRKMPHTMLGKCAEALALRKGFPQELSGLYEAAEMDQASAAGSRPEHRRDRRGGAADDHRRAAQAAVRDREESRVDDGRDESGAQGSLPGRLDPGDPGDAVRRHLRDVQRGAAIRRSERDAVLSHEPLSVLRRRCEHARALPVLRWAAGARGGALRLAG